jgi:hypothetical protein
MGSLFKDGGNMLMRIWQKLVALNHSRVIYGEDTLVAQGIQLAAGLAALYGIFELMACGTRCFTEKGLSQCAGVDFNAPQGPWKMPQPVTNLTAMLF